MARFNWEEGDNPFIVEDLVAHGYGALDIATLLAFLLPEANVPSLGSVRQRVKKIGQRFAPNPHGPVPEWLAAKLFAASIEARRYLPGPRREVVQRAVVAASLQFGLPIPAIVGSSRIRTPRACAAQLHITAALYDPATAGKYNHGFAYGISEVARVLGLNHATVHRRCGLIEARAGA